MFELKIKTGGAAFQDDCSHQELRRLLKCIEALLEDGITSGVLVDINGNRVGEWRNK
jgi:hypothetical protein